MPYTKEEFIREALEEILESLPLEKRLKLLSPEEIVKSLSPEDLIKALSPEQWAALLRHWNATDSSASSP